MNRIMDDRAEPLVLRAGPNAFSGQGATRAADILSRCCVAHGPVGAQAVVGPIPWQAACRVPRISSASRARTAT